MRECMSTLQALRWVEALPQALERLRAAGEARRAVSWSEDEITLLGFGVAVLVAAWIIFMAGLLRAGSGDPPKPKDRRRGE